MAPSPGVRRRGPLLACIGSTLVVLLVPLAVIAALDAPEPELRIAPTWERVSVLIADGDARVLIVNTDDRELARAVPGRLARPWEPRPKVLIAPADDRAAIGLWETLRRGEPGSVVVAGTPGADPLWDAIERECRERNIDLVYVTGRASVATDRLLIEILAPQPESTGDRVVVVTRGDARAIIALDGSTPEEPGHVLVTSGNGAGANADLVITTQRASRAAAAHEVVVGTREVVRVTLETSTMRVTGGTPRVPTIETSR